MKSKKYLLLGLTRTGSLGDVTGMQVDIPSTLVARLLLKIWQRSGFILDFNTIDPRDFNPLLAYLRDQFKNGQPSGVNVDLTAVSYPSGEWSATEDTKDSALVALSTLMAKDHNVWLFVKRIYDSLGKNMPPTDPKDPGASS